MKLNKNDKKTQFLTFWNRIDKSLWFWSVSQSLCKSVSLSGWLNVCFSVWLAGWLIVCLCACFSISPAIWQSFWPPLRVSTLLNMVGSTCMLLRFNMANILLKRKYVPFIVHWQGHYPPPLLTISGTITYGLFKRYYKIWSIIKLLFF